MTAQSSETCIGCAMFGDKSNPRALFEAAERINDPDGTLADKIFLAVRGLCPAHLSSARVVHRNLGDALDTCPAGLRAVGQDEPVQAERLPLMLATQLAAQQQQVARQSPLHEALQNQLKGLLNDAITIPALVELQKMAALARKLLELQNPKAKMMRKIGGLGSFGVVSPGYYGNNEDFDPEVDSIGDGLQFDGALAPSPGSETFGASVIRELIPAIKNQNKDHLRLPDLLDAVSVAEKRGNTELVERLQAKIESMLEEELKDQDVVPEGVMMPMGRPHSPHPEDKPLAQGKPGVCVRTGCEEPAAVTLSNPNPDLEPVCLCMKHYDKASVEAGVPT